MVGLPCSGAIRLVSSRKGYISPFWASSNLESSSSLAFITSPRDSSTASWTRDLTSSTIFLRFSRFARNRSRVSTPVCGTNRNARPAPTADPTARPAIKEPVFAIVHPSRGLTCLLSLPSCDHLHEPRDNPDRHRNRYHRPYHHVGHKLRRSSHRVHSVAGRLQYGHRLT